MSFRNERRNHQPPPTNPKLGIALSCGGAKSLAHVGVIQILEENGIQVNAISGSSMGAYIGALWAAGFDGAALAQIGSVALPRLYVLDPTGNIVWFDIEYSESTRRELAQTLRVLTGDAARFSSSSPHSRWAA